MQWLDRRYTEVGEVCARPGEVGRTRQPGRSLSIPNLITLARILLVPIVVWAIVSDAMRIAFLLFLAAGLSDAIDGFLAKRFGMATELGAYLDPLADKAMIVSIYVALGIADALPRWLVILVVSRDIMIVERDHLVVAVRQAGDAQAAHGLQAQYGRRRSCWHCSCWRRAAIDFDGEPVLTILMALVAILTLLSIIFYVGEWVRHMNAADTRQ